MLKQLVLSCPCSGRQAQDILSNCSGGLVWVSCLASSVYRYASVSHKPQFLIQQPSFDSPAESFSSPPSPPLELPQNDTGPIAPWGWTPATLALQGPSEHLGRTGVAPPVCVADMYGDDSFFRVTSLSSQLGPWLWECEHHL